MGKKNKYNRNRRRRERILNQRVRRAERHDHVEMNTPAYVPKDISTLRPCPVLQALRFDQFDLVREVLALYRIAWKQSKYKKAPGLTPRELSMANTMVENARAWLEDKDTRGNRIGVTHTAIEHAASDAIAHMVATTLSDIVPKILTEAKVVAVTPIVPIEPKPEDSREDGHSVPKDDNSPK